MEALAAFLRERAVGHVVARLDIAAISALKTFDPPPTAIAGLEITGAGRYGKFLDIEIGGSPRRRTRCTWSPTCPGPAGCTGGRSCRRRRRKPGRGPWPRGCTSTTAAGSTSPSRAPRSGSRSTWSARSPTCRASPGSGRTRSTRRSTAERLGELLVAARRPAQGRAHRPDDDRRRRQCVLGRDPARGEAVAVQAGGEAVRGRAVRACTRRWSPRCATRSTGRSARRRRR